MEDQKPVVELINGKDQDQTTPVNKPDHKSAIMKHNIRSRTKNIGAGDPGEH